jgi:predicted DCC family thiol-disulfide oxidoreductase YuxK
VVVAPAMREQPVILFDGVCNLCSGIVQFVIRHDPPPGQFKMAALQSEAGQRLLREHGLPTDDFDSFVLIEPGGAYVRSTAALRVTRRLGFPRSLAYGLIIVPRPLRDVVYRWIARNRYRWFGQREACLMPDAELRARFLE